MKKNKNILLKVIGSSTILTTILILVILICVLIIFDFFGGNITELQSHENAEYADEYNNILNKKLKDGYVPLQRLLYFYLEDSRLTLDSLYEMNQDKENKTSKTISKVCTDIRVKDMEACTETKIKDNEQYLVVSTGRFNFPLDTSYTITSFFNQQRIVYEEKNTHGGWDFAVPAQTPVYSVCSGTVTKVNFTQDENIPYDKSGNNIGNTIVIKCDEDYEETYYVMFAHLYPKSAKVSVGDKVNHWTEIGSVGTTGYSTGNHLHFQIENENGKKFDGMQFIDFTLKRIY